MPKPRYAQVALESTPYYHCISRCVRRAFLCGTDILTGNNYEHRRQWIEDKLLELGSVFALDICAYAVMSNHYHIVLHINKAKADSWDNHDVVTRWHKLFKGTLFSQRYIQGHVLSKAEFSCLKDDIECWRQRLMDISWYMRVLNEDTARQANKEDNCTGRFWEGRFKSQALLDESALMACMAYVDLNPIRAKLSKTLASSEHTAIKKRISIAKQTLQLNHIQQQPKQLMPFAGNPRKNMPEGLPFKLNDYLALVDWSGRVIRADKKGYISKQVPDILQQLNMETDNWLYLCKHFESKFKRLVGSAYKLKTVCKQLGYIRTPGLRHCESYFP